MTASASGASFRVLFVCTGNICRSPIAERLARRGLDRRLGEGAARFVVHSAGTWGHEGSPMEANAATVLHELDGDSDGFRGRELLAEHVVTADLVLTAAREHRAHVVSLEPRAVRRTFTIREFARLVHGVDVASLPSGDPVARGHALAVAAAGQRGLRPSPPPAEDDVADPYGAPLHVYRVCGAEIADALRAPLDALAPAAHR